eukprot:5492283-Pleurochrysis_carterae.AAC.1
MTETGEGQMHACRLHASAPRRTHSAPSTDGVHAGYGTHSTKRGVSTRKQAGRGAGAVLFAPAVSVQRAARSSAHRALAVSVAASVPKQSSWRRACPRLEFVVVCSLLRPMV